MPFYLSHSTAALFWLFARRPLSHARRSPSSRDSVRAIDSSVLEGVRACLCERGLPSERLSRFEFLAVKRERVYEGMCTVHFQESPFPRGSFCRLEEDFCVVSPELSFLQMAQALPFARLLEYGYALTGTFCYSPTERGLIAREPLTSVRKLKHYAENASGQRGRRTALKAIRSLMDKSASPAETYLALLMTLAHKYGGYALPAPKLNDRIDISDRNASLKSKRFYVADECWREQKIVIEYDSTLEHTGEHIGIDAKKRLVLQEEGYLVITVTASQLYSYAEMDKIALVVRRRLGLYGKPRVADYEARKARLRRELLLGKPLPDLVAQLR